LLERIKAEKEELIKAGKIKRDKKESVIFKGEDNSYYEKIGEKISCIDDEIQFEIPNSWEWCSITNINEIIMGSSPDGLSIQPIGNGVEFHQGKIYFTDKYIGLSDKSTNEPSKIAPANSVLLCVRAPVGEVNITQREICIGRGLSAIYPYDAISSNFLFYWLRTYKTYLNLQATGSTFVAITADTIKGIKIPLPPIEEQKRILQTIESLYAQLNNIEKSLG
jgi:type I restriction enzyme S subunit